MKIRIVKNRSFSACYPYILLAGAGYTILGAFANLKKARVMKTRLLRDSGARDRLVEKFSDIYYPETQEPDWDDDYGPDDDEEYHDEFEEAMDNCSGFWDGDVFMCGAVGSEMCDWECPFSCDIGKTADELGIEIEAEGVK